MKEPQLSANARTVLKLIAEGHSYEQILKSNQSFTYLDIFDAAREALRLDEVEGSNYHHRLSEIRGRHPRAYEKWTPEEDERLTELFRAGTETRWIANDLQRRQSAVMNRLRKLGLAGLSA